MSSYTKLFNSILASTVWSETKEVRIVWITLLAMANRDGIAEASIPGLAVMARLTVAETQASVERLLAPDPYSRSQAKEGRRIEPVDGGWRLINHDKYRDSMNADERREYLRLKQKEQRDKRKRQQASTGVNTVSDKSTKSTHTAPAPAPEATTEELANQKELAKPVEREKSAAAHLSPPITPLKPRKEPDPFLNDAVTERAGRFIDRYAALYPKHRHGARYAVKPGRDYQAAVTLCHTWEDDARLDKLAICFLTTDHRFAEEGSRTIPQFLALASWCDGELSQWEKKQQKGS